MVQSVLVVTVSLSRIFAPKCRVPHAFIQWQAGFSSRRRSDAEAIPSPSSAQGNSTGIVGSSFVRPSNLTEQLQRIVMEHSRPVSEWKNLTLDNRELKFKILTKCIQTFHKDVPNAKLLDIKTAADVHTFFEGTDGMLDRVQTLTSLPGSPQNLTILPDKQPYEASSDDLFNGQTAFPGRDTIKSSLRHRKLKRIGVTAAAHSVPVIR